MKYIDAEKLIKYIEHKRNCVCDGLDWDDMDDSQRYVVEYLDDILSFIASLQQEPSFPQYDSIVEKVFGAGNLESWEYDQAEMLVALAKEELLKSLQQEQPMPDSTKLIEHWHEDKEMLKEKDFRDDPWRLAYNAFMCGFGSGIAVNKQEQPEVDLEKEIKRFLFNATKMNKGEWRGKYPISDIGFSAVARHFYKLGLNARNEE